MNKTAQKSKICLNCPKGCKLHFYETDIDSQKLCPKGKEFFKQEAIKPLRHYFSSFKDTDGHFYAYRTTNPISKQEIIAHCSDLKKANSPEIRNKLHKQFIENYNVNLAKI